MNQQYTEGKNMREHQGKNSFLDTIIKILIILLLLGGVLLLGLFLKKNLESDNQAKLLPTPSTTQSSNTTQSARTPISPSTQATQAPSSSPKNSDENGKKIYTEEDMQEIMQMLIDQIQQMDAASQKHIDQEPEKTTDQTSPSTQNSTTALLSSLQAVPVDSIQNDIQQLDSITDIQPQKIHANNQQYHDTSSNKVVVENRTYSQEHIDDLSSQIGGLINDLTKKKKIKSENNYTHSIKKEVIVRESAMRVIIVKQGDSLSKIALRAYGTVNAYKKILQANHDLIKNPNHIYIGQRLRIPD